MARRRGGISLSEAILAAIVAAPGCAEELGVDQPPTTTVSGMVLDAGEGVSGGWIEFLPVDGTRGSLRSGVLGHDGTFSVRGVPVGTVAIGFAAIKTTRTDSRRFDSLRTAIRRTIRPEGEQALRIDLFDEMIIERTENSRR